MSQQVPLYPYGAARRAGGRYGPPGPPGPPPPPAAAGTNTMAILSIVFAFLFSPLGIVFGIAGRRQTARTRQNGRGLATAGLVLSSVFLVIGLVAVVYATFLATTLVGSIPTTASPAVTAPGSPGGTDPVATGPAGSATVGIVQGDYGTELPAEDLAAQVGAATGAVDVLCPGYLPAQVDASTVCSATVEDVPGAQLRTTVTSVDGEEASIDIVREG